MTSVKKMLKAALGLGTGTSMGLHAGAGIFGHKAQPKAPQLGQGMVQPPTPPQPPKPQTYDQSAKVQLGNQQKSPAQTGTATATTSGKQMPTGMSGDLGSMGNFLRGMVMPASGSHQDIGQWFGSPVGKMMTPMLGMAGPMAVPAISWMQQMMNGDTSRWRTLTGGPGTKTASAKQSLLLFQDIAYLMGLQKR